MKPPDAEARVPPLARVADAVGADGKIQVDLPCRQCGYNLRSLTRHARCPECNFPVARSLRRADIGYGDPRYATRLARGARLLFLATVTALAAVFLVGRLGSGTAAYLLLVAGAWLVTTPDPSGIGEAEYGALRRRPRVLLPIGLLAAPLAVLYGAATNESVAALATMLGVVVYVVGFAGVLALVQYLQRLAIRTGANGPVTELRRCSRGIALCVPPLAVLYGLKTTYGTVPPPVALACAVVGAAAIMGMIFTLVAALAGTWALAHELGAEAEIARALWPPGQAGDGP